MTKHLIKLLNGVLFAILITATFIFPSEITAQKTTEIKGADVAHIYLMGKSRPLRDLAPAPPSYLQKRKLKKENKPGEHLPPNFMGYDGANLVNRDALPQGEDPVRQLYMEGSRAFPVLPNVVIEGMDQDDTNGIGVPDTNGDVSPEHYIQIVNASFFQIFDKEGNAITGPTSANTIWNEIGFSSFSDPVIHYDTDAGRWLITDLANIDQVLYGVSETSDPLGSWFLYLYETDGFADYPKYGIWPEAYIFSTNEGFGPNSPVFAINRDQLLSGAAVIDVQAMIIPIIPGGGFPAVTPVGWSGEGPIAGNANPTFVRINDDAWGDVNADRVEIWTMDIDWNNPNNSTLTMQAVPTAAFDSQPCSVGDMSGFGPCIPQPSIQGLDGIATVVMNKVNYYNYGTHEAFAMSFTVDAGTDVAGIRWMEFRREPGNDWQLHQEGTMALNDGLHRFIPAISLNAKGDMALGYCVASEDKFASLRYTGRRSSDPIGEMTVDEFEFAEGLSAYTETHRFGDYACMSADPFNNAFWFTHEYMKKDGVWGTKIVSFSLTRDTFDLAPTALITPKNSPDLTDSEVVSIEITNIGLEPATNISVGYILKNGTPVIEPAAIDTLFPDSVYAHTFTPTIDLSVIGDYPLDIISIFAEDDFTRNDTLRRVVKKLPRFDVGVTFIEGLNNPLCDSVGVAFAEITNFGTETLTTIEVNYAVNGGPVQTTGFAGFLISGESVFVQLNLSGLIAGTNTLTVTTANPNNMADQVPTNDEYSRTFQVILGGKTVTFELTTDFFPNETSWQLEDEMGNLIYTGGGYVQSNATFIETWCLEDMRCYTFTIFDTYGDGLSSFYGDGNYVIKDEDGNVLASLINAYFGYEETNQFCLVDCAMAADFDITHESTSNSNDGAILISITAGNAPFQYSIDGGQTFQNSPLFEGLTAGVYEVVIMGNLGCTIEETITIETIVANVDVWKNHSIKVFPNPSESGVFRVEINGVESHDPFVKLQVVDALGRPVIYKSLSKVNGVHAGLLSLHAFPAGIYYIRFMDDAINQLVKVVRL